MVDGRRAQMLAIGATTGVAGGLLGVGGGFVMVPAMVYLVKRPQREANGTSLLVIVPVAIVGALVLGAGHQVDVGIGIVIAVGAVAGALLGARLTRRFSDAGLRRAFGIMALTVGTIMVADAVLHAVSPSARLGTGLRPTGVELGAIALLAGLAAGILSGLLGIGGGAIMVPAMTLLMGLSQHVAQGTSLLVIIPTALAGSIAHFRMGNIRLETAGWLSAGGVLGALGGALLALISPDQILRLLFGLYLGFTGARMLGTRRARAAGPTMANR